MVPRSIFVTSTGRTASMFLAQVAGRSRKWDVQHEPHPMTLDAMRARGRTDRYVEISPPMLDLAFHSLSTTRAVMLRDPRSTLLSALNRVQTPVERKRIAGLFGCQLVVVDRLIEYHGFIVIRFDNIVRSPASCQAELQKLGIDDVEISVNDMVKVNASVKRIRHPPEWTEALVQRHQWFARKYHL